MQRTLRVIKFEPRALESVYIEAPEHGVFQVLVTSKDCTSRLVESLLVTFDQSKYFGAHDLIMEDEVTFEDEFEGGSVTESLVTD